VEGVAGVEPRPGEGGLDLAHGLLGALQRGAGARDVDGRGVLAGVGQDDDLVREDLREAAVDREAALLAAIDRDQAPALERGHHREVAGQDAQLPVRPGQDDLIDGLVEDGPLGRDDLQGEL
jgi:hypothetical protein